MAASTLLSTEFIVAITTIFILSSHLIAASAAAATSGVKQRPFSKIYAFGDSYTDTGNTHSITGPRGFGHVSSSPYGSTFFHHSTNRYSDGRLVIDFVAEALSLPFLPPYLSIKGSAPYGVNFAVAGSTAIDHAFYVKNNLTLNITPQSINTQLLWFNKFLKDQGCTGPKATGPQNGCKAAVGDALFWVGEIGVNDYAYTVGSAVSGDTIRQLGIQTVSRFLQALLKEGAKHIVVQGLPLSGCLPLAMSLAPVEDRDDLGCVASANNQTFTHNAALQAKLQELRTQFPQATIVYADYWGATRAVMQNPGRYGFSERFRACCGKGEPYNFDVFATCGTPSASACPNPSRYINWDGVHLTEAMYKVITSMLLNGSFSHPPFNSLMGGKQQRQG